MLTGYALGGMILFYSAVDASTGIAVALFLRDAGHNVLAVPESMYQPGDSDILARAVAEARIVITNDKDFGELVFRSGQAHYGVVRLRLEDESAANKVRVISALLDQHAVRLPGSFTVATEQNIRIRSPMFPSL
jgi:predicted nuclease of predicted toxin-antitoxin system